MSSRYSRTKAFRFKDRIDKLPKEVREITAPVNIRIKPTNRCNHRCRYCAYAAGSFQDFGKDSGHSKDMIPKEKMFEIIEDLVEMGVKALTFSGGGEPLTYPHILPTVRRLAETPLKFASLTNGSMLRGELAELFSAHGTWVRVSIDGWDAESYSRYRNVPKEDFGRVMGNMESFKKLGGPCALGISLITDKDNTPRLFDMLKRFKDIGVDSVKVSPCLTSDQAAPNYEYHKDNLEAAKAQIGRAKAELAGRDFQVFDAYTELQKKFTKSYAWCPSMQMIPVIGADLNVYACPDKAYHQGKGRLGSIRDRRFKDFWNESKEKFFTVDPSRDCDHHCARNPFNQLLLEYLETDDEHGLFL